MELGVGIMVFVFNLLRRVIMLFFVKFWVLKILVVFVMFMVGFGKFILLVLEMCLFLWLVGIVKFGFLDCNGYNLCIFCFK